MTTTGITPSPTAAAGSTLQMNSAQMLRSERRFDVILCIETWNMLHDQDRFLNQMRELLSQSDEQDQAPYIEDN